MVGSNRNKSNLAPLVLWLSLKISLFSFARYTAEISMPDYLSLYSQLGAAPPEETWVMPTDDCDQLFDWETGYINPDLVPFQP